MHESKFPQNIQFPIKITKCNKQPYNKSKPIQYKLIENEIFLDIWVWFYVGLNWSCLANLSQHQSMHRIE